MRKVIAFLFLLLLLISTASAATLNVPSQYKTIQGAVNAAHNGDTISVGAGTYNENIIVKDKTVNLLGVTGKYPSIYGVQMSWTTDKMGAANVNGFKITKGVYMGLLGGNTIRNNYFYNYGVAWGGPICGSNTIMNNQFINCGIYMDDRSKDNIIQGNTIKNAAIGLQIKEDSTCKAISKNTFSGCKIAVQLQSVPAGMIGNTYLNNKINIKIVS